MQDLSNFPQRMTAMDIAIVFQDQFDNVVSSVLKTGEYKTITPDVSHQEDGRTVYFFDKQYVNQVLNGGN